MLLDSRTSHFHFEYLGLPKGRPPIIHPLDYLVDKTASQKCYKKKHNEFLISSYWKTSILTHFSKGPSPNFPSNIKRITVNLINLN